MWWEPSGRLLFPLAGGVTRGEDVSSWSPTVARWPESDLWDCVAVVKVYAGTDIWPQSQSLHDPPASSGPRLEEGGKRRRARDIKGRGQEADGSGKSTWSIGEHVGALCLYLGLSKTETWKKRWTKVIVWVNYDIIPVGLTWRWRSETGMDSGWHPYEGGIGLLMRALLQ